MVWYGVCYRDIRVGIYELGYMSSTDISNIIFSLRNTSMEHE